MCNAYEQHVTEVQYRQAIATLELASASSVGAISTGEVRIGDLGPVLRASGNGVELVPMRFGWPPPRPRAGPVFNFRSDNRRFADSGRCVIVLSGFYEFTGTKYPKTKHRFSLSDSEVMGIAGLWSEDASGNLSFTMLTTAPGPDIAPYHDRQVCVLAPADWAHWLFLSKPQEDLLRPLPASTLKVATVREGG